MRRRAWVGFAALLVVLGLPLSLVAPASAALVCTKNWVGPPGGSLATGANWSPSGVPGAGDVLCAPAGSTPVLASNLTVTGVVLQGSLGLSARLTTTSVDTSTIHDLTLASGELRGTTSLTGAATVPVGYGGTLGDSGTTTLAAGATMDVEAQLDVHTDHAFTVDGQLNVSGGVVYVYEEDLNGAGTVTVNGSVTVTGSTRTWLGWTYLSTPNATNSPLVRVAPGGVVDLAGGGGVTLGTGGGELEFENDGTVSVSSGAGQLSSASPVAATEAGAWDVAAGATLQWYGTRRPTTGATVTNAGTLFVSAAVDSQDTLTLPGDVQIDGSGALWGDAVLTGAAEVVGSGWFGHSWGTGDGGTTTVAAGATLTVDGSTLEVGADHSVVNDGSIDVLGYGALILFEEDGAAAASEVLNSGTLEVSGPSHTWVYSSYFSAPDPLDEPVIANASTGVVDFAPTAGNTIQTSSILDNDGTVQVTTAGIAAFTSDGFSDTGGWEVAAGATLEFGGGRAFYSGTTFTNSGTVSLSNSQSAVVPVTVPGVVRLSGPYLSGEWNFTGAATAWSMVIGDYDGSPTGDVTFAASGSFALDPYGSIEVRPLSSLSTDGTTSIPNYAGVTLYEEDGVGVATWSIGGPTTVTASSSYSFLYGSYWTAPLAASDPVVTVESGGMLTTSASGGSTLSTSSDVDLQVDGTLKVQLGTLNLPTGVLANLNTTTKVLSGGSYDVIGLFEVGSDITTNDATIMLTGPIRNAGANALKIGTNNGVLVLKRSLLPLANVTNNGQLTIDGAFTLTTPNYTQSVSGTTILAHASAQITSSTSITINGGTMAGIGRLNGPVTHNGGVVAPGLSPGTLSPLSTFVAGSGAGLTVEVDGLTPGTQHDRLAVTGAATVGGTLTIDKDPLFTPIAGDTVTVVTGSSRAGLYSSVVGGGLPAGQAWDVIYTPTGVDLQVVSSSSSDVADLAVTASPSASLTGTNTAVVYDVDIANAGPDRATGVVGTLTLPAGTTFVAAASDPACSESGGLVTCVIGQLSSGATWSGAVTLDMGSTERLVTAVFGVGFYTTDPNLGDNDATTQVVVSDGNVFLSTDLRDDTPDPVGISQSLAIEVDAENTAPIAATGVEVTVALPAGAAFVGATPSSGSCGLLGSDVVCTIGSLAPGGSWTASLDLTSPATPGSIVFTSDVSANEPDPVPGDDSDSETTTVEGPGSLTIDDVSVTEGDSGTVDATFTVTRAGSVASPASVDVVTTSVSATAGVDFTSVSTTVNFANGQSTATVDVPVVGDVLDEDDETFTADLSNPVNATISDGTGVGTVLDDDPEPTLSIGDVTVTEGDSGTQLVTLTLTLDAPSGRMSTVEWQTTDDTASAPGDYAAGSGTVVFSAGDTTETVDVTVNGDTFVEGDEAFRVDLSNPANLSLGTPQATITIQNDDAASVTLSVSDLSQTENTGSPGIRRFFVPVQLSGPAPTTVTFDYDVIGLSASAGTDLLATSGSATILAGTDEVKIPVIVVADPTDEFDETFEVTVSNVTNAAVVDPTGIGTILDDDGPSTIKIGDVIATEGTTGTTTFIFPVSLNRASEKTVSVDFVTAGVKAASGVDFVAAAGTVTFLPGATLQAVTVTVNDDALDEYTETFTVTLSSAVDGTIIDTTGWASVYDDPADVPPAIWVTDASVVEGTGGIAPRVRLRVELSAPSGKAIKVPYSTFDLSATAGADYTLSSGSATIIAGSTFIQFPIPVVPDSLVEGDEELGLAIYSVSEATVFDPLGVGTAPAPSYRSAREFLAVRAPTTRQARCANTASATRSGAS